MAALVETREKMDKALNKVDPLLSSSRSFFLLAVISFNMCASLGTDSYCY
jgi:hypothetical protein